MFTWEACLKCTKVRLENLKDIDKILMIEDGKRGGITQVAKRRVIANNNEMLNYNPKKPLKYMIYVDANNLYGHAMTKKLPINGFKSIGETSQFTQEFTII